VESSDDLLTWTSYGQPYYGLGQQVVIPMVEKSPASTPDPDPGDPGDPPSAPAIISLVMSPAPGGGFSLSFISSSTGAPVRYPFGNLTLSPEWAQIPFYVSDAASGYSFVIFISSQPQPLPSVPADLSASDQAALAVFTANFSAFDTEVHTHVQRTSSVVSIPATGSGDRRFFHIVANADLDSDYDGTPDWIEFAALSAPTPPGEPPADPFNNDTNGDGVVDGAQRDSDHDGTVDSLDVSQTDRLLSWSRNEQLLFATFELPSSPDSTLYPTVNDQGLVIYSNLLWKNGVTLPLADSDGSLLEKCHALGLGDNGFIYGEGDVGDVSVVGSYKGQCVVTWPAAGGQPVALQPPGGGNQYLVPNPIRGMTPDMLVNEDGKFIARTATKDATGYLSGDPLDSERHIKVWTGHPDTLTVTSAGLSPAGSGFLTNNGTFCGYTDLARFQIGNQIFQGDYNRAVILPSQALAVCGRYSQANVQDGDNWLPSSGLGNAIDVATDAQIVFVDGWYSWHNGITGNPATLEKSDFRPGNELMPGLTGWDDLIRCGYKDTTRHGWTLAARDHPGTSPDLLLVVPIFPSTASPGLGLDDQSAMADDLRNPAFLRSGNKDEFWVMIPEGGSMSMKLRTPATTQTPIKIGASGGITCVPASLTSTDATSITLSAPAGTNGQEFPVTLKIGDAVSSSTPLKAKVMKSRVLGVDIFSILKPGATPVATPTKAEIETYLQSIYQPQLNLTFNVTVHAETSGSEFAGQITFGDKFTVADNPNSAQTIIAASKNSQAGVKNIKIFMIDGYNILTYAGSDLFSDLNGLTNPDQKWIWLASGHLGAGVPNGKEIWLNTVAHELGHQLAGLGHPDLDNNTAAKAGHASLPGTNRSIRLMHSGLAIQGPRTDRKLLVKDEWDSAELWLSENIDP
jgi:hypothetical protein